jgi:hypothetical protein
VPVGDYIPGYGSGTPRLQFPFDLSDEIVIVHHGIKNRLFPDEATFNRTPYGKLDALSSKLVLTPHERNDNRSIEGYNR